MVSQFLSNTYVYGRILHLPQSTMKLSGFRPCHPISTLNRRSKASVWHSNLNRHPSSVSTAPLRLASADTDALLASLKPLPRFNPYFRPCAVSMSSVIQTVSSEILRPRRKSTAVERPTPRAM